MSSDTSSIFLAVGLGSFVVPLVIFFVVIPIGLAGLFPKLGAPASRGWIPFANIAKLFELGGYSGWWLLSLFFPIAQIIGWIMLIIACHNINRRLGKGGGMTVLAVFLFPVWALVVGLDRSAEVNPAAVGGAPIVQRIAVPSPVDWAAPVSTPPFVEVPPPAPAAAPPAPIDAAPNVDGVAPQPEGGSAPAEAAPSFEVPPLEVPPLAELPSSLALPEPAEEPSPLLDEVPSAEAAQEAVDVESAGPVSPVATPAPPPAFTGETLLPAFLQAESENDYLADETIITSPRVEADPEDESEATVVVRRRAHWHLETSEGQRVPLAADVAVLGRRPKAVPEHPAAQLVSLDDPGRTVSGTHALLELLDGEWAITDLDSTNGVELVQDGADAVIPPRTRTGISDALRLGDLEIRIVRES